MKLLEWLGRLPKQPLVDRTVAVAADRARRDADYWVQANRVLDALFLEYDVQTRDRRLYAQSMMAMMGFIIAAFAALSGAWAQSGNPAPLVLIAPLLLAGAEAVLVLRVHLLRVSVYLTLVEADIRVWLRTRTLVVAWETTMTGRIGATTELTSPGRSAPGLSLLVILAAGVIGALLFVLVGVAALESPRTATLLDWLPGQRSQQAAVYGVLNLLLALLVAGTWAFQPRALTSSRDHFRRVRSLESDPTSRQ